MKVSSPYYHHGKVKIEAHLTHRRPFTRPEQFVLVLDAYDSMILRPEDAETYEFRVEEATLDELVELACAGFRMLLPKRVGGRVEGDDES